MEDEIARVLVRMPMGMRRKLKVVAAMSNKSLNEQIISLLYEGLMRAEEEFLSDPRKMLLAEYAVTKK